MRTLILGLDGADWRVVGPLLNSGQLPTLRHLMERGSHGTLASTIPPSAPSAWTSMVTGVNPGKHGTFDFTAIAADFGETPVPIMSRFRVTPLWRLLTSNPYPQVSSTYPFLLVLSLSTAVWSVASSRRETPGFSHILSL